MHRIQIDEDDDTDNYFCVGGAFEISEDGINVVHEILEVHSNYVVASNIMTILTNIFDNKKTIAMLAKKIL